MPLLEFAEGLIAQYGLLGVFISTMLMNASILLWLPADLIVFSAGALSNHTLFFNPLTIGIVAGIGSAIGELTAWAVGWETEDIVLKKRHGKTYHMVKNFFNHYGFAGIVFFALTPLPLDVMGLFAGAVHYSPVKYFSATLIGKIPRCLILTYAGNMGLTIVLNIFRWML